MQDVSVILGCSYGSEGKGHITNYVARTKRKPLIVRHSGGAQSTNQIVSATDTHCFKHFGVMDFDNISLPPTFLSKYFCTHPIIFKEEWNQLARYAAEPKVFMDWECQISTPYDMIINQIIEKDRGMFRHGSAGIGFGETMTRSQYLPFIVDDLDSRSECVDILQEIRAEYLPMRLKELGIEEIPEEYKIWVESNALMNSFLDTCDFMYDNSIIVDETVMADYESIIFQGSHGLELDKNSDNYPHVTYAHTGMENVITLVNDYSLLDVKEINAIYVTRPYITKHGFGPFINEVASLDNIIDTDKTNMPHEYKGKVRYAPLDLDIIVDAIKTDVNKCKKLKVNLDIAVTCLDHVSGMVNYRRGQREFQSTKSSFPSIIADELNAKHIYTSCGPKRKDITWK